MASLWSQKRAYAINGPTQGGAFGGSLPPFTWAQFPTTPHEGLPEVYDNIFEIMEPSW
jgi:hypothetical protein